MAQLEVKDYYSSDIDSVWEWLPPDDEDVFFGLSVYIGVQGKESSDIWEVNIATPKGLLRTSFRECQHVISTRSLIVLERYSWRVLKETIEEIVSECDHEDQRVWQWKLQRFFSWEYEDYSIDGKRVGP